GGFAGAHLAGQQAGAVVIRQKLEPRLYLIPCLRSKQLLGVGAVGERGFLKPEISFYHMTYSCSFFCWSNSTKLIPVGSGPVALDGLAEGLRALTTASTSRASPCSLP